MSKEKINEIIVVEGKDDTKRLKEVFEVDTIETIGSAIDDEILERIAHAQEVRGVIVLTDPDFSGEKIRRTISQYVPEAKHAFISRQEGRPKKKGGSLGVEHASDQTLKVALAHVLTPQTSQVPQIAKQKLIDLGLTAGSGSKERREMLGDYLRIGYTNSKQLIKRLEMFRISEKELEEAMAEIERKQDE